MKKLIALLLALVLALTLCACGNSAGEEAPLAAPEAGPPPIPDTGTLSLLNMTEEQYAAFVEARRQTDAQMIREGYATAPEGPPPQGQESGGRKVVFYDTLDAMLMALNAGDIGSIEIYQSVARYLCATNDNLRMGIRFDTGKTMGAFAQMVQSGHNGNDFSFLMMEDRTALRDAFNAAIAGMKTDGTLDRLVREQIDDVVDRGEIKPAALPKTAGAETVRVAVTGALPPMDYVAADGTPAGFNTAVLAEIGRRTGKNIELVVVDSIGRAAALASGAVDAVFWTRTNAAINAISAVTGEDKEETFLRDYVDQMTDEERELAVQVYELIDLASYAIADMPVGTIATDPYYSDVFVPVELIRN